MDLRVQYFPFEIETAVDNASSLILHFTDAPLRRPGKMTEEQKARRAELEALFGRPDPKAVSKAMKEVFEVALDGRQKRRQCAMERLAVFVVWKNCVKRRWELGGRATPAMLAGLLDRPLTVGEILGKRLFRTRIALPARWAEYYDGLVQTPAIGRNRRHKLKLAY